MKQGVPASIQVTVFRYNPREDAAGRFQQFDIESEEPLSVMTLLTKIHAADPSFACRTSTCFKARCGSCLIRVNGRDVLGCATRIRPGESVTIEPHSGYAVLRDVVVDFSRPLAALDKEGGSQ